MNNFDGRLNYDHDKARKSRLHARARELHNGITRLAEDLKEHEGKAEALSAQESLSVLCLALEVDFRA